MTDPIRLAAAPDRDAIEAIIERAFAHYVPRIGVRPAPMDADYVPRIERGEVYVTGAPVAGVLVLRPEPDHAFLDVIAVDPPAQGRGLGRELMAFAERRTRELGLGELRLHTNELMTENLAFYAALGYREYDREGSGFRRVFLRKPLAAD